MGNRPHDAIMCLVSWLVCGVIGVAPNDIRNGVESVGANRGDGNGDMTITGVADERKLGHKFSMVHNTKNDLIHVVEWICVYFTPYIEVELHEIEFIPRDFCFQKICSIREEFPRMNTAFVVFD